MHGRLCEQRERRLHMWPNPVPTTLIVNSSPVWVDFFSKDGRKISTGDCALFKPPRDSPPFIGIIRRLIETKEEGLKLGVSWLYRPADIKLGKGSLVEAAPNEIFYSFHKDEIPAASLLHPCKVTFLRKGVELPTGVSSYVCRRVYDIENKCLWWLTDRDYINERQQEVDKLLDKPKQEMHGVTQLSGRSPKPLNGPTSSPQLKPSTDIVKHTNSSLHSQVQGKKRDQFCRTDDGDSGCFRSEHVLKSEIAKITEKGGLINIGGVEKLVQLMQPDSSVKRIDLGSRIIIADVIAVTDNLDCLKRFLQLRGLCVLDEWLQEIHKGKIGDCGSPNESENSVDGFILALLRALDKLPVNLDALQTCNAGKSVNHLRSHKNFEIQKKARSIVDTWKKRVEADMNMIESVSNQSVSWPSKPVSSEISHVGSRHIAGGSEPGVRSSVVQPCIKTGSGDAACKFSSATSPGLPKSPVLLTTSASNNLKDFSPKINPVGGILDQPWTAMIKDGKSSSSGQSPNNSQSSLSGSSNKISSNTSCHRKSRNGHSKSSAPVIPKEFGFGKFSFSNRNMTGENVYPDGLPDVPLDHINNQRLIVRLPNANRCPVRSVSAGSFDDPSVSVCRSSSSPHAEKNENLDQRCMGKNDALQTSITSNLKMESSQDKNILAGSDDATPGRRQFGEDCEKSSEPLIKSGDPSLSSVNAMLQSCVKITEPTASATTGDQVGIDLLASVAAGQITKSEIVSSIGSPPDSVSVSGVKLIELNDNTAQLEVGASCIIAADQVYTVCSSQVKSDRHHCSVPTVDSFCEQKIVKPVSRLNSFKVDLQPCLISGQKFQCNTMDAESQDDRMKGITDTVKDRSPSSEEKGGKGNREDSIFCSSSEMGCNDKRITPNESPSDALLNHKPPLLANILSNSNSKCEDAVGINSRIEKASNSAEDLKPDSCHSNQSNACQQGAEKCIKSGNLPVNEGDELKEHSPSVNSSAVGSDTAAKLDFDLNEGFSTEDLNPREPNSPVTQNQSAVFLPSPSPFTISGVNLSSVTFAAAAKGPFLPPENPLRSKGELGWKGSAATSAFRPAEPRKISEVTLTSTDLSLSDVSSSKQGRPHLDIDLNVPFLQNSGTLIPSYESNNSPCAGGFDFDLNRAHENLVVASNASRNEFTLPGRSSFSIGISNSGPRGFDLNGPGCDESSVGAEISPFGHHIKTSSQFPSHIPIAVSSVNSSSEVGNISPWFVPSSYTIPPALAGRVEQIYPGSQRGSNFGPEIYSGGSPLGLSLGLGSGLGAPFQYPGFPFETAFPLSSSIPFSASSSPYMDASGSQFAGPSGCGISSSHYTCPYVVSIPDNRKWGSGNVDLNAGGVDAERADERAMSALRYQHQRVPIASSHADEQLKMFQSTGGVMKRKEPDGGWVEGNSRGKQQQKPQSSWK